ncbi:MAG: ABC transporter substrate-binding protein [Micromonosporaceae bacterium]
MKPAPRLPAGRKHLPGRVARGLLAALAVASLAATGACRTADAADESLPARGGTLRVAMLGWPTYLDPQLSYWAYEANIHNLLTRTLTTLRPEPGPAGSELVADLATDLGRPNSDNTVWEFTIRDGVRWETGDQVTCQDLKYGIERRFSKDPDRQTGPAYPLVYLKDNDPPYEGPWVGGNNDGRGLESIECVDQRVVRFHLNRPVGDFGYVVSMAVFAPVKVGADDDRDAYNRRPLSTGPYKIAEHTYNKENPEENRLVLERNEFWDPATDPVRKAYPDRIEFFNYSDPAVMTNDLINDEGLNKSTIMLDWDIAATFLQQVMTDPELSKRVASGPMGAVRYLAVNTQKLPLECRQALAYAVNKRKFRSVFGGSLKGDIATTMIPPNLRSHLEFDHYGHSENPEGQPDRALEILAEAEQNGVECPAEITFAFPASTNNSETRRLAQTVVESYQQIGIHVETVPVDERVYQKEVLVENYGEYHLVWIGWVPDWPNGSSVIPPLFDGRTIGPGSVNQSLLNDERINSMIDEALAEPDLERQYLLWGELDSEIQKLAATIPLMYNNALRMHGSNVRGAFIHTRYGMPDLSALGLADPSLSEAPAE